ncbi:hypothetical protein JCM4814A_94000 [Streptomyces phaeofaciens JCM 4814]|uniref:CHAT domain-containing protein n=1 Tax=Streptomyces phaeofaciens TaxID=68254 RepID=A0A918HSD5_9ACTN|nr:hypothetical protein [Streptomyces phaeofaciens]GGT98955.1 hypothetical protein GCM10010226_90190 [Streptomyces phaeofaciens]
MHGDLLPALVGELLPAPLARGALRLTLSGTALFLLRVGAGLLVAEEAIAAVDDKPLLVLLNSCHSAAQSGKLVDTVPFAIGMSDSIGDVDAITYAAWFYAAVADGQSVQAAHLLSRAAIEMNGLLDRDLPTLACTADVDPSATKLVTPPPE